MDESGHPHHQHAAPGCPQCLVSPKVTRSAKFAWAVAGVSIALLVAVFFLGVGSFGGTLAASGGLVLFMALACPVGMGLMMWMMTRNKQ